MNPPLRAERDREALIDGPAVGCDRLHRDRPRAALARGEGGAVRAGADGRDGARDGVSGALHRPRAARACSASTLLVERMTRRRRALRAAGADARAGRAGRPVPGRPGGSLDGRGGRLREPLRELLLRGARAARAGADDGRARARSPTASGASRSGWRTSPGGTIAARGARREARPLARGAGRWSTCRRRSGPRCSTSSRWRATSAMLVQGARILGLPGARHRAVPEGARPARCPRWPSTSTGSTPIEKVVLQRGRRGRVPLARCTRRGATRCCCAASRPTCA